ncbi:MAG: hypothetical protein MR936_13135 [Eubacterium sp.]|nr:hypothetical protein [Eubacterium sp.]
MAIQVNLKDVKLASELDEGARIFLDDREIPYNSRVNIEAMFLLGTFSVSVFGCYQTLEAAKNCIGYADITRQGYPFYGGNLTYRIPLLSHGGEITVYWKAESGKTYVGVHGI